ncbi:unnamed protein product [Trichobilharzia regenti]|nr:unnamed protein product [Trichobilharzia regenti]
MTLISIDLLPCTKTTEHIYSYIPSFLTSYCTRKLNLTSQVGCSSDIEGNSGVVYFMNESSDISNINNSDTKTSFIIVLDIKHFINSTLMLYLRSIQNINGLVVFSNNDDNFENNAFSESTKCPNSQYSAYPWDKQCNIGPDWNPAGSGYADIDWPFPVVYVADVNSTIKATEIFCDELTGLNIILAATNSTNYLNHTGINLNTTSRRENSTLFVLSRMDSRSMFERSGFSSQGVLPSIAVLISVAAHLMGQNLKVSTHFRFTNSFN